MGFFFSFFLRAAGSHWKVWSVGSSVLCHLGHCVVWKWIVAGARMEARSLVGNFSCSGIRWQKLRPGWWLCIWRKVFGFSFFFFFYVKGEGKKRRNQAWFLFLDWATRRRVVPFSKMEKSRRVTLGWGWGGNMKQEFCFGHVKLEKLITHLSRQVYIRIWRSSGKWAPREGRSYFEMCVSFKIFL